MLMSESMVFVEVKSARDNSNCRARNYVYLSRDKEGVTSCYGGLGGPTMQRQIDGTSNAG